MKAAAHRLLRPSLWASSWALLWTALAILPDVVSTFVSAATQNPTSRSSAEIVRAGRAVDCTGSHSGAALQACVAAYADSATDKTWIFLPVRWADIEKTAGIRDWTLLDTVVAMAQGQEWEPVLSLQSVPSWLEEEGSRWDSDSPKAVSSFPAEFARFSRRVAERFGDRIRLYQLGQFANGPVGDFPLRVTPVRYGQMIRSAVPGLVAVDPDAIVLSAPLVPVSPRAPSATSPEDWLRRLEDTGAVPYLDLWLLQPGAVTAHAALALSGPPLRPGRTGGWDSWWLAPTADPQVQSVLTLVRRDDADGAADAPSRLWSHGTYGGSRGAWLVFLLLPLFGAAGWMRAVPPLAHALQSYGASGIRNAGWWLLTSTLLCTVYLVPSWLWAVGPVVLLSVMALVRPTALWLLTLAVLPLHQVHADFVSPLVAQTFSLAPAHILVCALTPVFLYRQLPALAAAARGYPAWLLGGWFLLLLLGGLGVTHTGHFSQWIRIGFFPGWLALLTMGTGLNDRNVRSGAIGVATGIGFFGLWALTQWAADRNLEADAVLRLAGPTFSPNHAAMLLERGLWLWLPLVWTAGNRWARMSRLGWTVLTAVALLLTLSRGALTLGLLGGLLAFGISWYRISSPSRIGQGQRIAVAVVPIGIALGICVAFLSEALRERVLDVVPVVARLHIWNHTWDMAQAHPWLGLGVDGFYHQAAASFPGSVSVSPDISHAHNVWLEISTRWGAAGWLWTVGLVGGLVWRRTSPSNPQSRRLMAGIAGALLAGLAHAQVDAFWYWPDVAAINLVLLLSLATLRPAARPKAAEPTKQNAGGEEPPAQATGLSTGCPQP